MYASREEEMYCYVRTLFLHKTCPMYSVHSHKKNPGPGVLDSVEMIGRTLG